MSAIRRFIPLFDRVLVEKAAPQQKTIGGIVLPESAQIKHNYGTVLELGSGKRTPEGKLLPITSIKKGDTVMLAGDWSGNKVKVNDKELYVVSEEEILGIVEMDKK